MSKKRQTSLGQHKGDAISPTQAGRIRPMCTKLSPEMKAVVWSNPTSNAGAGWGNYYAPKQRNTDSYTSAEPTIHKHMDRPGLQHSDAMLRPNQPRRGIPGAGYATFHFDKKDGFAT